MCRKCKGRDGNPFCNWAGRTDCYKCHVAKGQCFLAKDLQAEHGKLKKKLQDQEKGNAMDVDPNNDTEDLRNEATAIKKEIGLLRESCGAAAAAALWEKEAELKDVQAQILAAKPTGTQFKALIDSIAELQKTIDKRNATIQEHQEAMAEARDENEKGLQKLKELELQQQVVARGHVAASPPPDPDDLLRLLDTLVAGLRTGWASSEQLQSYAPWESQLRLHLAATKELRAQEAA
ncbi:unnamed protein product, partial [Prorocentrum cordatum]